MRKASKTWRSIVKYKDLLRQGLGSSIVVRDDGSHTGTNDVILWQCKNLQNFTVQSAYQCSLLKTI